MKILCLPPTEMTIHSKCLQQNLKQLICMKIKGLNVIKASLLICMFTFVTSIELILAQDKVVQLFSHRGGAHEQDENTLEAFKASYEKGLRGFETDVRISKDGIFII